MVGIAWPNHLAVFGMCIAALLSLTTKLVSLGRIVTEAGCAGCRWVEMSVSCEEHTPGTAHSRKIKGKTPPHLLGDRKQKQKKMTNEIFIKRVEWEERAAIRESPCYDTRVSHGSFQDVLRWRWHVSPELFSE